MIDTLEMDWDLTDLHFHDTQYYYLNRYFWSDVILLSFEDDFWETDPLLLTVEGLLTYKAGHPQTSWNKIKEVFNQNEYLDQVKISLAYIENKLGRKNSAYALLNSVNRKSISRYTFLILLVNGTYIY